MITASLCVSIVVILITYFLWSTTRRPKNYPPGPPLLPILGYLPFLDKLDPYKTLSQLRNKYGSVFSLKLGSQNVVFISDFQLAKQLFNDPGFLARPDLWSIRFFRLEKVAGVLLSEGSVWKEHRRFTLRNLRDFGFGKTSLEGVIMASVEDLTQEIENTNSQPFSPSLSINLAIVNVIWHMVADLRLKKSNPEHMKLLQIIDENVEIVDKIPMNYFPWLVNVLPESFLRIPFFKERREVTYGAFTNLIEDHKRTFDRDNLRDLIDVYLNQMIQDEENGITDSTFDMHQIICVMVDMFVAGSDTTSTSIKFALIHLINHPDIQKKIRQEIIKVVGTERDVSLNDRKSLPYLDAFIHEVLRFTDILPLGVPHATAEDVKLGDFMIPKGTTISLFQRYIHRDPTHWPEPNKFDPSRFLDDDGKLLSKKDGFLPFSIGKRQCLGEALARAELFLFIGCLIQRFSFSLPPGSPLVDDSSFKPGIVVHPPDYKVIATPI